MLDPSARAGCGISLSDFCSSSDRSVMSVSSLMKFSRRASAVELSAVELVESGVEDEGGQLGAGGGRAQPGGLPAVVAPRFAAGEQHPVAAEAAPVDLGGEPARGEPDRPGQVGVDLPAGRDPV